MSSAVSVQDKPQVGVLFVHGIGQQTPGETLIDFGDPLVSWLQRQLPGKVRIVRSGLSTPVLESADPGHLLLEMKTYDGTESRWLLAESCWAAEFRTPRFGRLATWMLGVGAWLILSHFGKFIRLRLSGWKRWALGLPVLLCGLVLALVIQLLVAALIVVAMIPIPSLRRALSGLLLMLTGTLGDSYVLISSPVQEAAAVSRLAHDLAWLSDRVEKVIVIAHSQGAAIARRALAGPRPENVSRLVTFGSGIGKLEELKLLAQPSKRNFYVAVQFGLPLALLSILLLPRSIPTLMGSYLLAGMNVYFVLVVLAPVLLLAWILWITWSGWPDYLERVRKELPLSGLEWHDFYSTSDPVPNGPLIDGFDIPGLKFHEVVNRRNALADHSAYWANPDEFVSAIVREISAAAGGSLDLCGDDRFEKASRARRKRLRSLLALRVASALGAALALVGLRDQLATLAERLAWNPLTGWSKTGLGGHVIETLASALGALTQMVTGAQEETLRHWGLVTLGALILLGAVAICHLLAARAWGWWDAIAIDGFFASKNHLSATGAAWLLLLLGATPLIFGGAAGVTGDLTASLAVVGTALQWYLRLFAFTVLLFLGVIAVYAVLMSLHDWRRHWKKLLVTGASITMGVPLLIFSVATLVTHDVQRSMTISLTASQWLAVVAVVPVGIALAIAALFFVWPWWTR